MPHHKFIKMSNIITINKEYIIREIDKKELLPAIEFVVRMNYTHHQCPINEGQLKETIEDIYLQESKIFDHSYFYKVVNHNNQTIGTLRIADWDKSAALPWTINLQTKDINKIYHIGRFAVSQSKENNPLGGKNIFKQLVLIAFSYVCENSRNILIAECDVKLFRTLRKLGIELVQIGNTEFCLGSETVCVYATFETIHKFYNRYKNTN